ncbi:ARH1 (YDR376W) [Zygosaccharomyces parabailii]|uniref:NADPH:adrenodoxin oxidoreductase, mitochondrial n=1 Tax=Zygosaccharomyces bailii (strain CLIB 213 / ATCC 58445 / CBS 680 / BCRC 21525 / NBRC 1098 / NCYC 1416 / NRRL Y-2227) TaxID=1333698 RepID=A0A8J2TB30_ZYGB2|nr:ARH1 (YDR376W) [Zygosaccharomyces parabailii]CDF91714.1 ZYBA0S13-01904g1_1 [Zygosaccharomyces bailii CLIB 213]CDH12325.1 probable NADPH:adrenodoxin oxidoreductase,mitochondrial [Zygosaccharomyces bailii ISA1307]SJM87623.1 probable Probable NADPH:adrenodoxin oxidoreductase, mitochondrial [Zygosaccharomyces bailii]
MILDGLSFKIIRHYSKRVSIVGSGPSGFYAAHRLLNKSTEPIHVTLWEKLPVPFGLSRYGVAPDHPEVKNCEGTFEQCAEKFSQPGQTCTFSFVGGVDVGRQVPLAEMLDKEDAVILAYGCQSSRQLHIPGEDATGVFSSRDFVNWYNGHPDFATSPEFTEFNWSKVRKVGIIGNGNVALDLARVLLTSHVDELWAGTDISPIALECLQRAHVEEVKIIARRDFLHSKFTNKELRELWALEHYGVRGKIDPAYFNPERLYLTHLKDRVIKRRIEICEQYLMPFADRTKKNYMKNGQPPPATAHWILDYLKSPIEIEKDANNVIKSLKLCKNQLTPDNHVKQLKDSEITYDLDVLIPSLGYQGEPMPEFKRLGIEWQRDHVANDLGRVLSNEGTPVHNLYAAGWIAHGSQGVIATTMQHSFEVADLVLKDLQSSKAQRRQDARIDLSHIRHTTWEDWEKINHSELDRGRRTHRVRSKYLTEQEMWQFLASQ